MSNDASREGANEHNAATVSFSIEGMHCASCVARVEKSLKALPGVKDARVNLATERATVEATTPAPSFEALARAVEQAGYKAVAPAPEPAAVGEPLPAKKPARSADRKALARVVLAGTLGFPLMALAMVPGLDRKSVV